VGQITGGDDNWVKKASEGGPTGEKTGPEEGDSPKNMSKEKKWSGNDKRNIGGKDCGRKPKVREPDTPISARGRY